MTASEESISSQSSILVHTGHDTGRLVFRHLGLIE